MFEKNLTKEKFFFFIKEDFRARKYKFICCEIDEFLVENHHEKLNNNNIIIIEI